MNDNIEISIFAIEILQSYSLSIFLFVIDNRKNLIFKIIQMAILFNDDDFLLLTLKKKKKKHFGRLIGKRKKRLSKFQDFPEKILITFVSPAWQME